MILFAQLLPVLSLSACNADHVDSADSGTPDPASCAEPSSWYADADGDAFGAGAATEACDQPDGFTSVAGDCDDADAEVSPNASEVWYDGIDQDCSGDSDFDHDRDGHDDAATGGDDCNDVDPAAYPGAAEVWYDGIDEDCLGDSDYDQDGDGHDAMDGGGDDCNDEDAAVYLGASEVWYDGLDQDCLGDSDFDQDGDGHDAIDGGGDDCNDEDATANPDSEDTPCNGIDDNCDGEIDEMPISLESGRGWVTSSNLNEGWNTVSYDDSAWAAPVAPAPENCGWTFTEANLGRSFESWEHPGIPTMWSSDAATHIYMRRTFEVPAGAIVTLAMLTSIVDDEHTVYLNGIQVGHDDEPEGVPIVTSDLAAVVVEGENVLAIDAEDLGGCRWAVVAGAVSCAQ